MQFMLYGNVYIYQKNKRGNKMNIILQMYINENLGDDLFIDIIANKYPNINFTIFGIGNRKIPSIYKTKYNNVHIMSLSQYFCKINAMGKVIFKRDMILERKLKKCDGLITLGGSVFIDSPMRFDAIKANILADVRLHALKTKKPIFVIGANFGPIYHEEFVEKYQKYFSKCINVNFRDSKSKSYYKDMANVISTTDVVFNYPRKNVLIKNKTVGISIIDLGDDSHSKIVSYQKIYEEKIIEIINGFIEHEYKVNMYSFCNKQGDNTAIYRIMNNIINKEKVRIFEYKNLEIDRFIEHFASNEYIIATRFHSMILGLIHHQKVFPIVYDIKTKNVIDELKLVNYCSLDTIVELKIDDILKTKTYMNIDKMQDKANQQFAAFENYYKLKEKDDDEQ